MVRWGSLLGADHRHRAHRELYEGRRLLPVRRNEAIPPALPAKEVTKVALRLKYQIEQVIPCELDEDSVTKANSNILTKAVIQTTREAGGEENKACVVYCLLVCLRWFKLQALAELWDSDLHELRAVACEVLAKRIIEAEENNEYLMNDVLLKRYSMCIDGENTPPVNAVERAVDLHALRVIGSSGYQKCIKYLWHGWLCQDDKDPSTFIEYPERVNTKYWSHVNPDRLRAPIYQNTVQIFFSLLYLVLYTIVINTINPSGDLDIVEGILYIMTLGFVCDEFAKFWKVGRFYFGFWNAFNSTLYILLVISFILRIVALTRSPDSGDAERIRFNALSYNFLAFSAPMFWGRILLYLDTFRFFGAMLVVLKVMMKESLIFFALLGVVIIGFLQGFMGMDQADPKNAMTASNILQGMANSVMQSPDFGVFQEFAAPFGILLYYFFTFVVMVILLNILIALYNSAYEDITGNAIDEYMALFAQRTLQFVRAPDENVFIAPLNLIEIFFLIIPFEWWLPSARYERLNHYVMGIIYSPLLLVTALIETLNARRIRLNRRLGEEDDDILQEWEEAAQDLQVDFQAENWDLKVAETKPNVELDPCVLEIRELKGQVAELMGSVKRLKEQVEGVRRGSDGGTFVNGVDEVGVTEVSSRDGNGEDTGPVNGEEGGLTAATEAGGDATGEPRE
ncbi:vacuolar cation channel [Histoplasma capsulatum G186AR]|uniref:Vacuolar cation channel n=1 Tax=Ajellomyces capsulatus TaxID=5037 RepID=A0A8H7YQT8_AJECA|nr:vacuolar cation channel [Histoplasma capsulatum]QSS75421.1 vacuolar cation channel [Histoplasma capsulatum G186AR]